MESSLKAPVGTCPGIGRISNTRSIEAIVAQMAEAAVCLPGHIRRPNPNTIFIGSCEPASNLPFLMNRLGLNFSGSGYTAYG